MGRRYLTRDEVLDAHHQAQGAERLIGLECQDGYWVFRYASFHGNELRIYAHLLEDIPDHNDVYEFPLLDPDQPWESRPFDTPDAAYAHAESMGWSGGGWVNRGMIGEEWKDFIASRQDSAP